MRRAILRFLLVLLLVGMAGLAWLTGHPEIPALERAARWPGVGPWVERFRALYRIQPEPTPAPSPGEPEIEIVTIWLPERRAPLAEEVEPPPGGAPRRDEVAPGPPPLGQEAEPPRPLPARPADPTRLARAEALLGERARRGALGPYALLADARSEVALDRIAALAGALDSAFAERTGLAPLGEPAETVVLFFDAAAYRELQGSEARLAGLDTGGHASAGLAALWCAGRSAPEVESTLVHELVHFVIRRALGPALPPWLDEGLAEDLAQAPFDAERGVIDLGGWRLDVERSPERIEIRGAYAALDLAARSLAGEGRLSIDEMMRLDWEGFVGAAGPLRYAQALAWIRFLFDGDDGARAARFREFLAGVARGESAAGERLLEGLGEEGPALEAALAAWLRRERMLRFAAAGLPLAPASQAPAGTRGSSSRQSAPPSP